MNSPILISNVNHYYGQGGLKRQVLFDVNLAVESGEIVIMMGPSGSGKTTLLSLMGCLRSTQAGSLKLLGQELAGASKFELVKTRHNIGYIFQSHNLLQFLTVEENVRLPMQLFDVPYPEAQKRAQHFLEIVGLSKYLKAYPENLSHGQCQRVAIARALVNHPKIILADEPTSALDKQSGRDVVELLQKLAKDQHCTIVLVTHDDRILDIADRIVTMEDGHLSST
ncbi:ATP-binding cassette domain-containing protein [Leptolyngbya sp. AN03gr2]|uniref:ATP-binding cassette domain-containing protein n=1 Tax=unclassified Leptolyngbya TaxID=2650499 RepID=UPI003D318608